jgi:hypothetical protein
MRYRKAANCLYYRPLLFDLVSIAGALFAQAEEQIRDLFSFIISHFTTEPQMLPTNDLAGEDSLAVVTFNQCSVQK